MLNKENNTFITTLRHLPLGMLSVLFFTSALSIYVYEKTLLEAKDDKVSTQEKYYVVDPREINKEIQRVFFERKKAGRSDTELVGISDWVLLKLQENVFKDKIVYTKGAIINCDFMENCIDLTEESVQFVRKNLKK